MTSSPAGPNAVRLLDVNLLVALAWPHHVLFPAAQRWFSVARAAGWATTSATEAGLARLSMNPSVAGQVPGWPAVMELIRRLRDVEGYRRWENDVDLAEDPVVNRARVVGHRQVTDVLLVAVAARHAGLLATVDRGVVEALHPDDRHLVDVVPAG
jgi:uncharacterized protein